MNNQKKTTVINDFVVMRESGMTYVDKTMYISAIEESSPYLFFIRPRGFGMTTLHSMLMAYYDVNMKESWARLFNGLYVSHHPTAERSKYVITKLDFSVISGNLNTLGDELVNLYKEEAYSLMERYRNLLSPEVRSGLIDLIDNSTPGHYINEIARAFVAAGYKIYMFLDRYDCAVECIMKQGGKINFTDARQMENLRRFLTFFDTLSRASEMGIDKVFATGTVPITIQSLLGGFEKGKFCTTDFSLACLVGFTEQDVRNMLLTHKDRLKFQLGIDEIEAEIKKRAGGYCFSPGCTAMPQMYKPSSVMAFFEAFEEAGYVIPSSTAGRDICRLLTIRDSQYDAKTSALKYPFAGENIVVELETVMLLDRLHESRYFISMLYYYGLLTIRGEKWNSLIMGITNDDAWDQIAKFLDKSIKS